jgi:TolA-binding protein
MNRRTFVLRLAIVVVVAAGCDSERLARMAEQSTREQSAQNQRVSQAHASLAEGSKQLVEADANARRDLAQLQDKLREDQSQVNEQRDALEAERKSIASERRQDSQCSSALATLGILLACLAPLVLAGIALAVLHRGSGQQEVDEVLVHELAQTLSVDDAERERDRLAMPVSPRLPPPSQRHRPE